MKVITDLNCLQRIIIDSDEKDFIMIQSLLEPMFEELKALLASKLMTKELPCEFLLYLDLWAMVNGVIK